MITASVGVKTSAAMSAARGVRVNIKSETLTQRQEALYV